MTRGGQGPHTERAHAGAHACAQVLIGLRHLALMLAIRCEFCPNSQPAFLVASSLLCFLAEFPDSYSTRTDMTFKHAQKTASPTWLLVAARGKARIFARPADGDELALVDTIECPSCSAHMSEVVTDRQGYFKGREGSLDAGDARSDFKHHTADRFAAKLVARLEKGRVEQKFGHLELVAAPSFLGALRSHLTGPLAQMVRRSIARDYTSLPPGEITKRMISVDAPESAAEGV